MEEFSDSLIVSSAAVSHGDRVHSTATQHWVFVGRQTCYQCIALLQTIEHCQSDANCQSSKNFFMLSFLSVLWREDRKRNGLHEDWNIQLFSEIRAIRVQLQLFELREGSAQQPWLIHLFIHTTELLLTSENYEKVSINEKKICIECSNFNKRTQWKQENIIVNEFFMKSDAFTCIDCILREGKFFKFFKLTWDFVWK